MGTKIREVFIKITKKALACRKLSPQLYKLREPSFPALLDICNVGARAVHVTRRDYLQIRTVFNLSGVVLWCEIKGKDLVELQ